MRTRSKQPEPGRSRRRERGFTLIDVMITIVILGILVGAPLPLYSNHYDSAAEAAAKTTYDQVRKALDMHWAATGQWPAEITEDLFTHGQAPFVPTGYSLTYDPATGELELISP